MKKLLTSTVLVTGTLLTSALAFSLTAAEASAAEDCGSVTIAEMNWASAGVAANVDKFILENGYDCSVSLVTGDTMPTFTSMNEKGQPDMAPEMWANAVREPLTKAVEDGRLIETVPVLSEGGVEGWWIPKYFADAHPEIKTVEDALAHPELFPAPEDASKGAVYNCPSGWNCEITTSNLFRAYKAGDKGFDLIDSGSAAGLDGSIASAFEKQAGWLGYYWSPTTVLGKYEMVKLDAGVELDQAAWDTCTAVADCPDPKVNAYPVSEVVTVITKDFAKKAGVTMDYVKTRQWDNTTVGKVLAWMDENQGTNEDGARYFFENYEELWSKWLPQDVAEKVKAAL
jgi:glycine betaine/proline transport system substrate-binding protein